MPSLRKKVSTYFRQLSFHNNEPRQKRNNINENAFVTKYLQGQISIREGPPIVHGKTPEDLPNHTLGTYEKGFESIVACSTGPGAGLTTVKRVEKYLSIPEDEPIDFIDTPQNEEEKGARSSKKLPEEWNRKNEMAFGASDSLYDLNLATKSKNGDPVADCFGIISRGDSMILAVADGVNWGEKACIAAKSAVHGSLHYLNKTIFNDTKLFSKNDDNDDNIPTATVFQTTNTREVFVCLLRAFNCAHDLILENKGMLTTLTVAVVLPLENGEDYVCCVCNVGDTLAYVYSHLYGVRELTKGSHDVNSNRDMRDALGALGPVEGINPELSNLTLSLTVLKKGDIVMVASDGLTDNFDPNVCKFTTVGEAQSSSTRPKPCVQQLPKRETAQRRNENENKNKKVDSETDGLMDNPLIAHFIQQNSVEAPAPSTSKRTHSQPRSFLRSKTTLDNTHTYSGGRIVRNEDGIPCVTPIQRYELQLLLMEDILKRGISGNESACATSKKLCENLMSFTYSITAAKRRTLEDTELYFDCKDGVRIELSAMEKKTRRRRWLEKVSTMPGKLDHVTVVAGNVGNVPCG